MIESHRAVEDHEAMRIRRELEVLRKTFTSTYYRIEPRAEGGFLVTIPAVYPSSVGRLIGTATIQCDTWDEAKNTYLREQKTHERLTHEPLIDIALSSKVRVAFSHLHGFCPEVAPGAELTVIPEELKTLFFTQAQTQKNTSTQSYDKMVERREWKQDMMKFLTAYLEGSGKELKQELRITSLEALTPKQAMDVSTRVVIHLTKYYVRTDLYWDPSTDRGFETTHDRRDALEILEEGLKRKGDPTWEGNGVCRNFASTVKAVFEALKAAQGEFTRLNTTFCFFEGRDDTFDPKRENGFTAYPTSADGHAWNTFVTLSETGSAHAVIADVTWANRDLKTGAIEGLDQTLTRMEPFLGAALEAAKRAGRSTNELATEREKVLSYYLFQMERLSVARRASERAQLPFFASRCLALLKEGDVARLSVPSSVLRALESVYLAPEITMEKEELIGLWRLYGRHRSLALSAIAKKYLTQSGMGLAQRLHFYEPTLQAYLYQAIPDRAEAAQILANVPLVRSQVREVEPGMFGRFDPVDSPEDAKELRFLLGRHPSLDPLAFRISSRGADPEAVRSVFAQVRAKLQAINPEHYAARIQKLSDYTIIQHFTTLSRDLEVTKTSAR